MSELENETPELSDAEKAFMDAQTARSQIRQKIFANAGDRDSILGTTSDATQILLFGLASLVAKLATAQSLAEVRAAAAPFAAMSGDFLSKVASGEVKLPFQIKGTEGVIQDIEKRATAVSDTLIEISKGD